MAIRSYAMSEQHVEAVEAFFRVRPLGIRQPLLQARHILCEPAFGLEECWKWRTVFYRRESDICYLLVRGDSVLVGFVSGALLERSGLAQALQAGRQKTIRHFLFQSSDQSGKDLRRLIVAALAISSEGHS
jgi:hypothetical protein